MQPGKVGVVEGRLPEHGDDKKCDCATPRDQQEPVNEAQRIRLKAQPGIDEIDRTLRCRWQPGRLPEDSCRHRVNVRIGDPVVGADVQPKKIRVQLLTYGEKVAHVDGAGSSPKQTNGVEECRKGQDVLRLRQASCEYSLQDDAS